MKVYLAGRYSRRVELSHRALDLHLMGHDVTSRWLSGGHEMADRNDTSEAANEERRRYAEEDLEDVVAADVLISFTEPPGAAGARGGRHVEFGMGVLGLKRLVVVGPREHVFHYLAAVRHYDTWEECVAQAHEWDGTDIDLGGSRPQLDIEAFCNWADTTFPHSTPSSIVAHLRREVDELTQAVSSLAADPPRRFEIGPTLSEAADCHLLLLHLCRKLDVNLSVVSDCKFQTLKRRAWGAIDHEGVVEHIREEE